MPESELHKVKRKKNFLVLAIIFGICVLIWAVTMVKIDRANAADGHLCGAPSSFNMPDRSPVKFCDIYTRQLIYREEAIKMRQKIHARAVDYSKPRAELYAQYKANLEALHERISEENIPTFFSNYED